MRDKLITVYLKDVYRGSFTEHGHVEEHLDDYLNNGYEVITFVGLSGNGGGDTEVSAGWIVVHLKKP